MKPSTLLSQGLLNRRIQEAQTAWERQDFQECIKVLESARRLAPVHTGILLQLGRVYGLRYDYAAAERCFEQALRITPRKTEIHTAIADSCQNFRNPELAERHLRRAVESPDATPQAYVKLAELCERLRRLPEAEEMVERALKLNPALPAALLVRARLERLGGRLELAKQGLQAFVTKPQADFWVHAQAWYELGAIWDRQGCYDQAMTAFLAAKQVLHPHITCYFAGLKLFRERMQVMQSNVSVDMLRRWSAAAPELAPAQRLALLCGYARSGTTLLEQVLDTHPDICSAEETEVFLDEAFAPLKRSGPADDLMLPVLEKASLPALRQSRVAYYHAMELCLGRPLKNRLLIDKNPVRTFMIPAYLRVFPEIKLLVALRDPRDVVLSCFMKPGPPSPGTAAYVSLEGCAEDYVSIMSIWRTLAPLLPAPHLEVRYEEVVQNLESVARKTLDFLGMPWDEKVLGFDEHARNKIVLSPTYADVTQPVYKRAMGRWRNYQKYLEPHLEKLEPFVKAFGYE